MGNVDKLAELAAKRTRLERRRREVEEDIERYESGAGHLLTEDADIIHTFAEAKRLELAAIADKLAELDAMEAIYRQARTPAPDTSVTFAPANDAGPVAAGKAAQTDPATAANLSRKRGRPSADNGNEVTQSEAAAICGVTKKTIQNWEAGIGKPEGYPERRSRYELEKWAYNYKGRIKAGEQRARELAASQQYEIQSGQ